jgi:hypothetical protein
MAYIESEHPRDAQGRWTSKGGLDKKAATWFSNISSEDLLTIAALTLQIGSILLIPTVGPEAVAAKAATSIASGTSAEVQIASKLGTISGLAGIKPSPLLKSFETIVSKVPDNITIGDIIKIWKAI